MKSTVVLLLSYFVTGLLFTLIIGNGVAFSQSKANEVYKKVSPAVVFIKTDKGAGTGFIVAPTGVIVTALHIVDGVSKVAVKTQAGDIFDDVSLLAKDERKDIAILKINGFELPTVVLGNSNDVNPGDQVIVIGNPLGAEQLRTSVSDGIVSGIRDFGEGYKVIQVTAAVSAGNSGGPAVSASGEVIGIVVFRLKEGESLNFALPINYARGMLSSIETNKPLARWQNTAGTESIFAEKAINKVTRWKSLVSGTTKLVRNEGDYIYIETEVPDEMRKLGVFLLTEVKKQGDKYIGIIRERTVWWQTNKYTGEKIVTNSCTTEYQIELTSITPIRIEGRILEPQKGASLDRKKCTLSKPLEWHSFVWIPE